MAEHALHWNVGLGLFEHLAPLLRVVGGLLVADGTEVFLRLRPGFEFSVKVGIGDEEGSFESVIGDSILENEWLILK